MTDDVVVVGGGSAGAVVAARLSEDTHRNAHELRNDVVEELIVWRVNISRPERDIAERRSSNHRGR